MAKHLKPRPSRPGTVDEWQAGEIRLWILNDYPTYRIFLAWVENFALKKKRGKWNRALAIQGLRDNLVPEALRRYRKECGGHMMGRVSWATKHAAAVELLKDMMADYGLRNVRKAGKKRRRR